MKIVIETIGDIDEQTAFDVISLVRKKYHFPCVEWVFHENGLHIRVQPNHEFNTYYILISSTMSKEEKYKRLHVSKLVENLNTKRTSEKDFMGSLDSNLDEIGAPLRYPGETAWSFGTRNTSENIQSRHEREIADSVRRAIEEEREQARFEREMNKLCDKFGNM